VIVSKDHRVGIDIELVTEKVERIKHKFLNEDELLLVNGQWSMVNESLGINNQSTNPRLTESFGQEPINQLTLLWSCKESVFKWYGSGGVDFKDDIHLKVTNLNKEGIIDCDFMKEGATSLKIQHKYFDGLCLAWVATAK
jgi:phosphopantetheinyl transferase